MEAVPRLPMLSFELKLSPENTEFGPKLKKYIRDYYHEDPETYQKEIKELEGLRVAAIRVPRDYTGCSTLKRYYSQLFLLQKRFHMTDDGAACVPFMWCDIYSGMVFNITDIKYEQACILYNIGALHSELGAMDSRQTSEGMKISCTHFQCAAWAFQHLRDNFPQPKGSDMSHDLLCFFLHVMLAQAQECILEKSMLDSRKSTIIAKVASQIVDYYKQAQKTLDIGSKNMETGCIADIVGSKLFKAWQKYLQFKMTYHSCVAYMYMGNQAEEQQKMGERLGYLQAALDKLNEAIKLAKHMDKEELSESLVFTMDVVGGKYEAAKKENEFIYHEKVPAVDTLPEIKGASLVKGIPFQPTDPEVCGPDIFARLVPMETHEASSLYSEEKAKILRHVSAEIEEKNNELETYLSSLQLEQLKMSTDQDRLPQELVDCCAALSVQPTVVKDLIAAMQSLSGLFHDVESALQEIKAILEEEEAKEKVYQELMGKRAPSMILLEMRKELSKYQEAHAKASESNSTLHRAMNLHVANLRLLTGSLEELQKTIPSIKLLDIPSDESAYKDLERLAAKVEEMKSQRSMLENQLREQIQSDDITKRLVAHEGQDMQELFVNELKKHEKLRSLLEQNLGAQDNILRALTQANARCAATRKSTNEVTHKRTAMINSLIASYEAYEDLLAKSQKGLEFYRKLEANVSKLLQRCRGVCKVQEEERQQMLEKSNKKVKGVSTVPNPQSPMASESGPKLKDYLQYMHPVQGQQINQIQSIMPEMVGAASIPSVPIPAIPAAEDSKLMPKPTSGLPSASAYAATQSMYDTPASLAEAVYLPRPAPVGSEQADLVPPHGAKDYSGASSQPPVGTTYFPVAYPSNYVAGYGQYPTATPSTPTTPTPTAFFSAPQTTAVPSSYYSPSQPNPVPAFTYAQQPASINQPLPSSSTAPTPVQPSKYPTASSAYQPTYPTSTTMSASVPSSGTYPTPLSSYSSYPQAAAAQYPEQAYALPYGIPSQGIYSMPVQSTSGQFYPQSLQSADSSCHDPNQLRQSAGGGPATPYSYSGYTACPEAGDGKGVVSQLPGYGQAASYGTSATGYQYQQAFTPTLGSYNYSNYGSGVPYSVPYSQNATNTAMQYTQAGSGVAQTCVSSGYYQYSVSQYAEPSLAASNVQPVASSEISVPYSYGDYSTPVPQPLNTHYQPTQYPQYQTTPQQQQPLPTTGYVEAYSPNQASVAYGAYSQGQVSTYPAMPSHPVTQTTTAPSNGRPASATQTIPSSSVASSNVVPAPLPAATDPNSNIHLLQQLGQLPGAMAAPISPAPAQLPPSSQVTSRHASAFPVPSSAVPCSVPLSSLPANSHDPNSLSLSRSTSADLLSSSPDPPPLKSSHGMPVLTPKVLSVEDIHRQQEEMNREAQRSAPKDPYSEPDVLSRFVAEVERFEKVVDGLTKQSLNGPTPLDQKWKELIDTQDKESRKLSISIARCYSMKNRLADVMPYDGTRVHITATKDDYINASFLKDISQSAAVFIATQAPLPCTYADFWQMAFEQQTEIIVCLTSDAELKAHIYFPNEKNQSLALGLLSVSLQSVKARPWGIERVINIVNTQTRITRVVIHLQCTIWPPSENPSLCPFLQLVSDAVNLHQQQRSISRPVVVHCGAGIGRTGVFCLIMAVMEDINAARGIVDIAAVATRMNQMRKFVIQDKEQLRFCYEAVLYYARDLLMKRGILSAKPSFEDKLPMTPKPGHSRHPSADFILGLANLSLASPADSTKPKSDEASNEVEAIPTAVPAGESDDVKIEATATAPGSEATIATTNEEAKVEAKAVEVTNGGSSTNVSRTSSRSNSVASVGSSSVIDSPQHLSSTNLPASLANLDATNFSLDPMPTKGKRKITRESFLNPSGSGLAEPAPDPTDPLSQLDPLWTIHKKAT